MGMIRMIAVRTYGELIPVALANPLWRPTGFRLNNSPGLRGKHHLNQVKKSGISYVCGNMVNCVQCAMVK